MGIIFPISVDEVTNRFHVNLTNEAFEYLQFLFFVYPDVLAGRGLKTFRSDHLLDFDGQLKLTIRELDIFCQTIISWKHEMDTWQGPPTENPFSREYKEDMQKSLVNDVDAIIKIIRPQLIDDTTVHYRVEK